MEYHEREEILKLRALALKKVFKHLFWRKFALIIDANNNLNLKLSQSAVSFYFNFQ